mmetsp:Transcript_40803/g.57366  ORF Transcript_40803/g.57366 Transcript_40803/m.57366 type:complete len:107 (-) Transcript_40803:196-516(-)
METNFTSHASTQTQMPIDTSTMGEREGGSNILFTHDVVYKYRSASFGLFAKMPDSLEKKYLSGTTHQTRKTKPIIKYCCGQNTKSSTHKKDDYMPASSLARRDMIG